MKAKLTTLENGSRTCAMTEPVPGRKPGLALLMRLFWAAVLVLQAVGARAQGIDTTDPSLPPHSGYYRATTGAIYPVPGLGSYQLFAMRLLMPSSSTGVVYTVVDGTNEVEQFSSKMTGNFEGIAGGPFPFSSIGPVSTEVFGKVGKTTGTFDTQILGLNLTPYGAGAHVWLELAFVQKTGQTTITDIGGGLFHIDSTIYMDTAISIDGGKTWFPQDYPDTRYVLVGNLYPAASGFEAWQLHYFGCTNCPQAATTANPAGDGMINASKFLAGFCPTNSAAYPHIISLTQAGNDMSVTYLGANGDNSYTNGPASRTNVLEYTSGTADGSYTNNFVSTGQTNILSGGTGLGIVTNMVDAGGATNTPSRYYRVRVLVP
jgi:hypothetical protein